MSNVEIALLLAPNNPDYLQMAGRVYYYQYLLEIELKPSMFAGGLSFIRKSLEVRPFWPYAWAELANLKSMAGQYDSEFEQALLNAEMYGPWESQVIANLILSYFGSWEVLTSAQKDRAYSLIMRLVDFDRNLAKLGFKLALDTELAPYLCLQNKQQLERLRLLGACGVD